MASSQKYWQYARRCAQWADQETFERMATAWVHLVLVDEDVIRQARYEPEDRLHL
jgi:hypothetical protein